MTPRTTRNAPDPPPDERIVVYRIGCFCLYSALLRSSFSSCCCDNWLANTLFTQPALAVGGGGACPNAGRWGTSAAAPTVERPLLSAIVQQLYRQPQLTYATDHPGNIIPALRFTFEVTPPSDAGGRRPRPSETGAGRPG